VSWLRWLEPDRLLMAEAAWIDPRNFCVRRGDWKAIHQPYRSPDSRGHGLFDLATDPGESTNLLDDGGDSASARFDELISSARRLLEDAESPVLEPASSPLGRRQRHRLEELGYLQGGR
jgi:arylsulfatase A-like enzyme